VEGLHSQLVVAGLGVAEKPRELVRSDGVNQQLSLRQGSRKRDINVRANDREGRGNLLYVPASRASDISVRNSVGASEPQVQGPARWVPTSVGYTVKASESPNNS